MAAGAARSGLLLALLVAVLPLAAQAQLAPPRGATEQFGEQLAATQEYVQRRWLMWSIRSQLNKNLSGSVPKADLAAQARRLGTRGPSAQDWTALNAELTREIDAYFDWQENFVRTGQVRWPQDRPRRHYDNTALILIESIRVEAKQAVARRADPMPAMMRGNRLYNGLVGNQQFWNFFFGGEESVEEAMRTIKMPAPRPSRR